MSSGSSAPATRYGASFTPRGLPRILLIVALVLLACHAALAIIHYRVEELPWLLRQLFDLDEENNLPTWYSGFLLLVVSVFLWLCGRRKRADADPWFGQWYALAVGFLLLSVDEGDQSKRMVIGFGAGASELRVDVQVYQETEFGARRISEGEADASGSKMPGMAVPVGAGAAAGRAATSAAISGAMSVTREIRGGMSADTKRLAEKIADRAEAFYQRQGWL